MPPLLQRHGSIRGPSPAAIRRGTLSGLAQCAAIVARSAAALRRPMRAPHLADIPEAHSLTDHLQNISRCVFGFDEMRPNQLLACEKLLDPNNNHKMFICLHTGAGKTHIIRVAGVYMGGITIIIHLILALTSDQVNKFIEGSDNYGAIGAHNMDEITGEMRLRILARMRRMKRSTTTTLFLFVSPHLLARDNTFVDVCIQCAECGIL